MFLCAVLLESWLYWTAICCTIRCWQDQQKLLWGNKATLPYNRWHTRGPRSITYVLSFICICSLLIFWKYWLFGAQQVKKDQFMMFSGPSRVQSLQLYMAVSFFSQLWRFICMSLLRITIFFCMSLSIDMLISLCSCWEIIFPGISMFLLAFVFLKCDFSYACLCDNLWQEVQTHNGTWWRSL